MNKISKHNKYLTIGQKHDESCMCLSLMNSVIETLP